MKQLTIGNRTFTNRFFLGTGKFASSEQTKAALAASETELVTVALTRVHEGDSSGDDILRAIDRSKVEVMLNTSGARRRCRAVHALRQPFAHRSVRRHPRQRAGGRLQELGQQNLNMV